MYFTLLSLNVTRNRSADPATLLHKNSLTESGESGVLSTLLNHFNSSNNNMNVFVLGGGAKAATDHYPLFDIHTMTTTNIIFRHLLHVAEWFAFIYIYSIEMENQDKYNKFSKK